MRLVCNRKVGVVSSAQNAVTLKNSVFDSVEITKVQPCNRIYYSTVH
jgi:hypothetical protein